MIEVWELPLAPVFGKAVAVSWKNWMVVVLPLTGRTEPVQKPGASGPPANQSRGETGVPVSLELSHTKVAARAGDVPKIAAMAPARMREVLRPGIAGMLVLFILVLGRGFRDMGCFGFGEANAVKQ